MQNKLLDVKGLKLYYPLSKGVFHTKYADVRAVDGIDFYIDKGETLGLVGESGCGKTTTARCVIQLLSPTAGTILFEGRDMCQIHGKELRRLRREIQIIFQDPYSSLDPLMEIEDIISEPLRIQKVLAEKRQLRTEVVELLRLVHLEPDMATRYPHEFSGGQRQRIAIARALALKPKLVICDEPVSALDVSTQGLIVNLLLDLQERLEITYLFISHDLSVVRYISNRIAVMYLGKMVEVGEAGEVCEHPQHPYTQALLSAVPIPDPFKERERQRIFLKGEVPSAIDSPGGCRFHPRCRAFKLGTCDVEEPILKEIGTEHFVSCHLFD